MKQLRIEEYRRFDQIADLRSEWDHLVDLSHLGPAHHFNWCLTLWEVHWKKNDLIILVVREGERIVGIAPLKIETERQKGVKCKTLSPLNSFYSNHGTQLILFPERKYEIMKAIFQYLRQQQNGWNLWVMTFLKGEEQAIIFESLINEFNYNFDTQMMDRSPYLLLEGTWEGFLKSKSANFRSIIGRKERKLQKKFNVEFKIFDSSNFEQGLEAIYEIERESWKSDAGTSITSNSNQEVFYRKYTGLSISSSLVKIPVLYVDGEPIAYDYGLIDKGVYYLLKTSYKEKSQGDSPGIVFRKLLMEWLFSNNASEIDFLGKDEVWKMRWTDTVRGHICFGVINKNFKSRYIYSLYKLSNFIKSS